MGSLHFIFFLLQPLYYQTRNNFLALLLSHWIFLCREEGFCNIHLPRLVLEDLCSVDFSPKTLLPPRLVRVFFHDWKNAKVNCGHFRGDFYLSWCWVEVVFFEFLLWKYWIFFTPARHFSPLEAVSSKINKSPIEISRTRGRGRKENRSLADWHILTTTIPVLVRVFSLMQHLECPCCINCVTSFGIIFRPCLSFCLRHNSF